MNDNLKSKLLLERDNEWCSKIEHLINNCDCIGSMGATCDVVFVSDLRKLLNKSPNSGD